MQLFTRYTISRVLCAAVLCSLMAACGAPPVGVSTGGATAVASTEATTVPTLAATPSIVPSAEPTLAAVETTEAATATVEVTATPLPPTATMIPATATPLPATATAESTATAATVATTAATTATVAADASTTPQATTIDDQTYLTLRGDAGDRRLQMSLWRTDLGLVGNYIDLDARAIDGLESTSWVSGTLDDAGNLTVRNIDGGGSTDEPTVAISATLARDADVGAVLDGTWTEGDGVFVPVRLAEVRPDTTAYTLTSKTVEERDDARSARYTVTYPVLEGAGAAGDAFTEVAAALIDQRRDTFKSDVEAITATMDLNEPVAQTFLHIRYQLADANDRFVSMRFEMNSYFAGAAHPNTTSFVLTYDLVNNREVALTDLFMPESDYLAFLSQYSLEKLRTRTDMELFEERAAPMPTTWRLTPTVRRWSTFPSNSWTACSRRTRSSPRCPNNHPHRAQLITDRVVSASTWRIVRDP